MANIATLGIVVDATDATRQIKGMRDELGRFVVAGNQAIATAKNLGPGATLPAAAPASVNRYTAAIERMRQAARVTEAKGLADQIAKLDTFQEQAATHATSHALALGRVGRSMETLIVRSAGLNDQFSLLAASMGHMQFGELAVVGVLSAVAAGIVVWDAWTDGTRKAAEAQVKLTDALEGWFAQQDSFHTEIDAEIKKIGELKKKLDELMDGKFFATAKSIGWSGFLRILTAGLAGEGSTQLGLEVLGAKGNAAMALDTATKTAAAAKTKEYVDALNEQIDAMQRANAVQHSAIDAGDKAIEQGLKEMQVLRDKQAVERAGIGTKQQITVALKYEAELQDAYISSRSPDELQARRAIIAALREQEMVTAKLADQQAIADYGKSVIAAGLKRLGSNVPSLLTDTAHPGLLGDLKQQQDDFTNMLHGMQRGMSSFFEDIFTKGISTFRDLFDGVKGMFTRMLADMAAQRLASSMAGFIGTAAVGSAPASGAGGSILGGIGAAISAHPVIAATVGLVALGSAILSTGDSARAAHDAFVQFKKAFDESMDAFRLAAGTITDTQAQMNQVARDADALRVQAEHLNPHFGMVFPAADAAYKKTLEEINALEAKRLKLIQQQALEGLNATIGSLQAFKGSLALGGLSTLSPVQQLAEARRQYDDIVAKAKAGDQNAANQLPQFAQAFLNASRSVNASGAGYQQDFARVNADTDAIMAIFKAQATAQQVMIDILNAIRTGGQAAANQSHEDATDLIAGIENLIGATRQLQGAPV